jgi:hypothetical protein
MSEEKITACEGRLQIPEKLKMLLWERIVERQLGPRGLLAADEKFGRYTV